MAETPYAETEALLALLNGNDAEAERILLECYPNELDKLAEFSDELAKMSRSAARVVRARV